MNPDRPQTTDRDATSDNELLAFVYQDGPFQESSQQTCECIECFIQCYSDHFLGRRGGEMVKDYLRSEGSIPEPSTSLLLEVERPFRDLMADTRDKLQRADLEVTRLRQRITSNLEVLKAIDAAIEEMQMRKRY
jgi:hypothetical protein